MLPKLIPPRLVFPFWVFAAALFLQAAVAGYLLELSNTFARSERQQWQTQITQEMATQISHLVASNDDLGALVSLRNARSLHPQLQEAVVVDNHGRILLHTDPGWVKPSPSRRGHDWRCRKSAIFACKTAG
jgi:hypothetical protein